MKKTLCIIFVIILAGAIMCFFALKSEETQPVQKSFQSPDIQSPQVSRQSVKKADSDILADIEKAQQILQQKETGFTIMEKRKKGKWEVSDFKVLLAIQHTDKRIEVVSLDPETKQADQGYVVDWSRPNGVNTNFTVLHPEGCTVLAIKRVIKDEKEFAEVVYTPYTREIDCESLRNAGLAYLKRVIEMARADLRKVSSQSSPNRSVSETVQTELALVLAIIEHIDPDRLTRGEPIEKLIDEVLVVIGANQGMAFRYSVSKANARGMFQFRPGTYAKIREQYQDAGLKEDFIQGMNNHFNAAKASLLLFDSDLRYLNQRAKLKRDKMSQGRYLASAYNCGAKRTAREIKSDKGLWENKVPKETRLYLKKFSAVWNSLIGA